MQHVDVPAVVECIRYYAGWADKIQGKTIPVNGEVTLPMFHDHCKI